MKDIFQKQQQKHSNFLMTPFLQGIFEVFGHFDVFGMEGLRLIRASDLGDPV